MVTFVRNQEVVVTTPTVQVDNKFSPGVYTFSLVVTDTSNNASAAATLKVSVREALGPTVGGGLG
jgi:hypothetical protein